MLMVLAAVARISAFGNADGVGRLRRNWRRTMGNLGDYSEDNSFIDTNLIDNFYINYIKLSSSTCFERHVSLQRMRIPEAAYMYS